MGYWATVNEGLLPGEQPGARPLPDCADRQVWTDLVEDLRAAVLEDYDFDLESSLLDLAPQAGAALKESLGIDPDYFTAIPANPTRERLEAVRRELHELGSF
jgi:hypothetical protein